MFLKKKHNIFRTVTFRVTAQFVGLFTLLSAIVIILFYFLLASKAEHFVKEKLIAKATGFSTLYQERGIDGIKVGFELDLDIEGTDEVFCLLLSPKLEVLVASDLTLWEKVNFKTDDFKDFYNKEETFKRMLISGSGFGKMRIASKKMPDGKILLIGEAFKDLDVFLGHYFKMFGQAIVIMLVLGGFLGFLMTKRMMDGVKRATQTAMRIGKGDLSHRVPIKNEGEEMDNLAIAFNDMLGRIHGLVTELREMVNNIAHDLRSPITRIRGMAETTLTGKQTLSDYQEMAGNIIEESDNLVGMINTTLEIAETKSGGAKIPNNKVNINTIVKDAHDLFQPVAENKRIKFDIDISSKSLLICGNISMLQRAIANLIDNAIKFTPDGGRVQLSTKATETHIVISVNNTGVGISKKDLPHIFERFYRAERSRSTPGNGLGLSLAQAIILAHAGKITVKSSVDKGTTFEILLPRSSNI